MSETHSAKALPPHFRCDCVPDLGPAHCHRCSGLAGAPVEWENAPCGELVESFAYGALLSTKDDAALLLISESFDKQTPGPAAPVQEAITVHVEDAAPKPHPAPATPRVTPTPPKQTLQSEGAVPWRFTKLASSQINALGISQGDVTAILDAPHVVAPSRSGTATNHYGNDLLLLVDENGECIISVIESRSGDINSSKPARPSGKQKKHRGGPGRRMPSNVKELLSMLKEHGFDSAIGGRGHHQVTHPLHPTVQLTVPSSPSDHRSFRNAVADIKRLTGIDITKKEA